MWLKLVKIIGSTLYVWLRLPKEITKNIFHLKLERFISMLTIFHAWIVTTHRDFLFRQQHMLCIIIFK